jgi:hypothetical protein
VIDVFLRSAPQSWIRTGMAISCIGWWIVQPDVKLHVLFGEDPHAWTLPDVLFNLTVPMGELICLPMDSFHWASRAYADTQAQSTPYVLTDDDRLPIGKQWLERALALWERHSDYAMLCPVSYIPVERPPEHVGADEVVSATNSCGAPYFAAPHQVPYATFTGPANQQDQIVCDWMRQHNVKHGWMRDVYNLHLGFGYSQVGPTGVY